MVKGTGICLLNGVGERSNATYVGTSNARGLNGDGGHENLPIGGHGNSPLADAEPPQWRPSDLPTRN